MKISSKKCAVVAALSCAVLGGIAVPAAHATPSTPDYSSPASGAQRYSDSEIVALLVFGDGRAAQDHPDLGEKFAPKVSAETPAPSAEVVDALTDSLIDVVPNFHETVTLGVQRQDPFAAQTAMTALGQGLRTIASQKQVTTLAPDAASTNGVLWHDANVFTEINGVAVINVAGYANAAVATAVAWVLYVTPGAISYEFPTTANSLDSQNTVAQLASDLSV